MVVDCGCHPPIAKYENFKPLPHMQWLFCSVFSDYN